jgi:hypothetical protein
VQGLGWNLPPRSTLALCATVPVPVCLGDLVKPISSPLPRCKDDGVVPGTQHVNLAIVGERERGRGGVPYTPTAVADLDRQLTREAVSAEGRFAPLLHRLLSGCFDRCFSPQELAALAVANRVSTAWEDRFIMCVHFQILRCHVTPSETRNAEAGGKAPPGLSREVRAWTRQAPRISITCQNIHF